MSAQVRAVVVLSASEGKRLIAKAVASLPEVQRARHAGRIIIAGGTTNAYIAEELTGKDIIKEKYTAGIVQNGTYAVTEPEERMTPISLINGEVADAPWSEVLEDFDQNDVFIKGANAFDPQGMAGVLLGSDTGGTCGKAMGIVYARGSHLIIPVGRNKMIPSVPEAVRTLGINQLTYCDGLKVGMYPIVAGKIVTEDVALQTLFPVRAVVVSGGGAEEMEGGTGISLYGHKEDVGRAFQFVQKLKEVENSRE